MLAARKPANLSFEQAATIPIAFLTADYCLADVARLEAGESVLIHAAAGGVGQAAIQIARRIGAEILGTASPEKHDFLREAGRPARLPFPESLVRDGVRAATGGRGVDVVLNSLAGEFIPRTLELLAPGGRFVEIGKKDIFQNAALDLNPFRGRVSFTAVDLAGVVGAQARVDRPAAAGDSWNCSRGASSRRCRIHRSRPTTSADAFRLMAQGKHRGKLVVTRRPDAAAGEGARATTGRSSARDCVVPRHGRALRAWACAPPEWLPIRAPMAGRSPGRSGAKTDAAKEASGELSGSRRPVEVVAAT